MANSKWLIPAGIIGLFWFLAGKAKVMPPPGGYICPYCQIPFDTFDALIAHVQAVHPGERMPLVIDWD